MSKAFTYILNFKGNTQQLGKDIGGMKGMLKGAAVAAGALFAADKVMDAAKAVADYAQEISKVNSEVKKLTGLQGAAADAMTGQMQAIADGYKQDVSESLKASNAVMKAFGESAGQTFDIMNAGFATTANSNGDFLKQLSEYSVHFAEAGLAASEMVAIIAEGNKMGVFDDKSADAIKEGSIRLREMTKSTRDALGMIGLSADQIQRDISSGNKSMFEVMQLVSRQLQTLPQQSPAVGAALADIFGGPGEDGIQFIRMLGDVNTNLDEVVKNAGGAAASQMEWADELAEFHTVGAQVFGGTNNLITQVKTTMLSWVNDGIKGIANLANYFIDLYNESMLFRGMIQSIKFYFTTTFDAIKLYAAEVLNIFSGIGKVIAAVFKGDFSSIPGIVKDTWNEMKTDATEFGTSVAESFTEAVASTLTPREKIKLISLSTDVAEAAGNQTGQSYLKGLRNAMKGEAIEGLEADSVTGGNIPDTTGLADMGSFLDANTEKTRKFKEELRDLTEQEEAVVSSMEGGFAQLGAAVVNSLGLASSGMEGFLGTMAQAATKLISMMMAEALAAAIKGASIAAAFTGPGAVFAQPAFIGTAIAGIMAAFASIPKFEFGGIVGGTNFTGDRMLARLNSGEEVLRRDDPRHAKNFGMVAQRSGGGTQVKVTPVTKFGYDGLYVYLQEYITDLSNRT